MYKHILLATDLSDETEAIARTAASISQRCGAKLSIVYILEHTPVVYGGGEFSIPLDLHLEEQLANNAREALASIASRFNISPDDQFISHGSVKHGIIELANKLSVDLIVAGSHGHSGLTGLLGSTANAILHAAKCDVLAIRIQN